MSQPAESRATAGRTSRRGLLLALAGAAATPVLAGCSPDDPTVSGPGALGAPSGTASRSPDAALARMAGQELAMAGWLASVARRASAASVPAGIVPVLAAIRDGHVVHAQVLSAAATGAARPSAATPTLPTVATTGAWPALTGQLAARERTLQATHRAAAQSAADPSRCLLFASLAAYAGGAAQPTLAPVAGTSQPATVTVGSRLDSLQVLLGQLRALAQGLEIGAGQLPLPSDLYAPARQRLADVWTLRDLTEQAIIAAKGTPDASLASYRMPGGFGSPTAIRRTWGQLELAVLNAQARLAAASSSASRSDALDQVQVQASRVLADGVPLPQWPGWA